MTSSFLDRPCLSRRERAGIFLAALAVVIAAGWPHPFSWPTYWDGSLGPMTQAIWLLENHFDYRTLVDKVPGYAFGGPKVYLFSVWPPAVAGLMKLTGSPAVTLAVLHALTHLLAAGFTVVMSDLLCRLRPGLARWAPAALVLSLPFFLSQANAVNMEMPVLLAMALALRAYFSGRHAACSLWLLAGFAVKQSVIPLALALSAGFLVARCRGGRDVPRLVSLAATPLLAWILGQVEALISHLPAGDGTGFVMARLASPAQWLAWNAQAFTRTPGLMAMAGLLLALGGAGLVRARRAEPGARRAALEAPVFALTIAGLLLLFNTLLRIPLPRYVLNSWPAMLAGLALLAPRMAPRRLALACAVWSALQLSNLYGFWPRLLAGPDDEAFGNNGYILERSLECRDDLALQREVFRVLEEKYRDKILVTTWPLLHHGMRPWYGYVKRGFPAMAMLRPGMQWAGAQSFWEFRKAHPDGGGKAPADFLWVWTDNVFAFPPPPPEHREALETIEVNGRTAEIFRYTDWPSLPEWALRPVL